MARAALFALAAAVCALSLAAPAAAQNLAGLPNWPEYVPANPNDSAAKVPLGFDVCPKGGVKCPPRVIKKMIRRWRPLDRSCNHNAVFALTYLRTTQEFERTVKANPHFSSDPRWINHEDAVFAQLYFRAYDAYAAGRAVPNAWRIAFQAAKKPNLTALGDLLLGMNAHINRDLAYTLAHVGLVKPNGQNRKLDHDKVNQFLDRVIDPLQDELARRYDPLVGTLDAEPSPADEVAALQAIRMFRENAWRNAERLVNARSAAARRRVSRSIELEATLGARSIQLANTIPGYGATRDAFCRAAH